VPAVSVVIPAYNAASFIGGTLECVAAQTFKDLEAVVVDDGSTDGTAAAARAAFARLGLRGSVHEQENKKIAGARNAAIARSSAPLVAFLDADDSWRPEKLERVLAVFAEDPAVDLVCHDETVSRDGKVVREARYGRALDGLYERLLFEGNAVSTSATVVRRAKLEQVGGFRENPAFDTVEDYDLWMRLAKVARFRFLHEILGDYRLAEGSASSRAVYHRDNLVSLLQDHFAALPLRDPARERRRLASVDRAAARALLERGDAKAASGYAWSALRAAPLDWKNAATVALCAAKRVRA
jgi:glycosyltransferase involved in cell wall biosynthesis